MIMIIFSNRKIVAGNSVAIFFLLINIISVDNTFKTIYLYTMSFGILPNIYNDI